jgi:hypothetical protein
MKTVSVIAHRRPKYLRRTLDALAKCRRLEEYFTLISIDGPKGLEQDACVEALIKTDLDWDDILLHDVNRGVDDHPFHVYETVFSQSEFNVVFEEDVVPASDSLELATWFHTLPERDQYACLCLHNKSRDQNNPLDLFEAMRFCPWGWAVTKQKWEEVFRPEWNAKKLHPKGWDWGAGLTIQRHGLKSLAPSLSRTLNIGRDGGTYEQPDNWDRWAKDLVCSDGTHGRDYRIASRLPEGFETSEREEWVMEELKSDGSL